MERKCGTNGDMRFKTRNKKKEKNLNGTITKAPSPCTLRQNNEMIDLKLLSKFELL